MDFFPGTQNRPSNIREMLVWTGGIFGCFDEDLPRAGRPNAVDPRILFECPQVSVWVLYTIWLVIHMLFMVSAIHVRGPLQHSWPPPPHPHPPSTQNFTPPRFHMLTPPQPRFWTPSPSTSKWSKMTGLQANFCTHDIIFAFFQLLTFAAVHLL